jgi:KUP system potassium uptake protein
MATPQPHEAGNPPDGFEATVTAATSVERTPPARGVAPGLTVAALGVVFGDIGTSPLYAVRQSLIEFGQTTPQAILGVISLIAWSLILVVTIKYVIVIMRADNRGEGGLLSLTALVLRNTLGSERRRWWIMAAGLVGASLFYGDGIITPAISVLSAVEGLKVATPIFDEYVVPISLVLLIGLFVVQRHGTAAVGGLFGPIMLLWFTVLGGLGIWNLLQNPLVLRAFAPWYAIDLLIAAPGEGFFMLGAVFLAVTGAETLYADMGHFGRRPLRTAWLYIVFPALLLNYFGQGALLLRDPQALQNPFYHLVPHWGLYPLVALASTATIIASQAVISGAFSYTRQAIQLGYLPRLVVRHTSETEIGQVYAPRVNHALLAGIIILVLLFRSSDNLGAAYGIAVSGDMTITTGLAFLYMRSQNWSLAQAIPVFAGFATLDLSFLIANLLKFVEGGWFPILVASVMFLTMSTWWRGRRNLAEKRAQETMPLATFLDSITADRPPRIAGTAVIMARDISQVPTALLHAMKHYKVLHARTVLMSIATKDVPHVADEDRLEIHDLGKGFYTLRLWYGFLDEPNVLRALAQCRVQNFRFNLLETSFIIGREKLVPARRGSFIARWRKQLFILMSNNALDATEFFRIPPNRVVELGGQIEI